MSWQEAKVLTSLGKMQQSNDVSALGSTKHQEQARDELLGVGQPWARVGKQRALGMRDLPGSGQKVRKARGLVVEVVHLRVERVDHAVGDW